MSQLPSLAFSPPASLRLFSSKRVAIVPRKPRTRTATKAVQQQSHPVTSQAVSPPPVSESDPKWLVSYLMEMKRIVDLELDKSMNNSDPQTAKIIDSMRYSLLAGGKRVRPALAIAAFQMFAGTDAPLDPVLPSALAVEMIHTMSLIHDDLPSMDNDDFRRGKPTNHMVYGEDIAILAGDALLAYSFEYVAKNTRGVDPSRVVDVLGLLAASVGPRGLAGGQVMDLENEGKGNVDLDTLTWIHTHKTAALLKVSCASGAIIGGANKAEVEIVSDFAVKIGLAFQIADDVLDVTQSTEVLGKTAGKDEATDKATYPRLLGLDGSRAQAEKLIADAKESLKPFGSRANTLLALADFIINRSS